MSYSQASFNSEISYAHDYKGVDSHSTGHHGTVPDYFGRPRRTAQNSVVYVQHPGNYGSTGGAAHQPAGYTQCPHHQAPLPRHYVPPQLGQNMYHSDHLDVYSEPSRRRADMQVASRSREQMCDYDMERFSRPKHDMMDKKIFIGGLDYGMGDAELVDFFVNRFGPVEAATVVKNRFNMSRGFGFVIFKYVEHADRAIREAPFLCNGTKVDIRKAIPKAKMAMERERVYPYGGVGYTTPTYGGNDMAMHPDFPVPSPRYTSDFGQSRAPSVGDYNESMRGEYHEGVREYNEGLRGDYTRTMKVDYNEGKREYYAASPPLRKRTSTSSCPVSALESVSRIPIGVELYALDEDVDPAQ